MFPIRIKLSVLAASTAIGITAFVSRPAQAANFNIQFFDESGKNVGQGSFSAKRTSEAELNLLFSGADTSAINIGKIKNWLYIQSFQVVLDRFTWNSSHANFWDPEQKVLKHIGFLATGEAHIVDRGIFDAPDELDTPQLILVQNSLYQLLGSQEIAEGVLLIAPVDDVQAQSLDAVPEAPTLLGSLTAMGILTLFKRVISKKDKNLDCH
jgi:hypothetical protein